MPQLISYQGLDAQPTTGDPAEKARKLDALYAKANRVRKDYEIDWELNISYLAGNQRPAYLRDVNNWDRTTGSKIAPYSGIVANGVYVLARQAVSAISDNLARQVAVAPGVDEDAEERATRATDLLDALHYWHNEDDLRVDELLWTMSTGIVGMWAGWDPWAESPNMTGERVRMGEIERLTVNPWQIHLCPWGKPGTLGPWFILSDVRDIDEINDKWPGHDVQAEEVADNQRNLDRLRVNVVTGNTANSVAKREHAAILKVMYCEPTRALPKGWRFVWASGKLLQAGPLPEGRFPMEMQRWFPVSGRLYSLPFISPLRPIQFEINKTLQQLIEIKDRQLRGDKMVRGGARPTEERDDPDGGGVEPFYPWEVFIDPDSQAKTVFIDSTVEEVEFIQYALDVGEGERLLERLWNEMMQLAGIHESALGQRVPAQTTATATLALKESDLAGLTLFRAGMDRGYARLSALEIVIAGNHYLLPRTHNIPRGSSAVQQTTIVGSDLAGVTDVRPMSVPVTTQTMVYGLKREAADRGVYGPYAGPEDMLAKMRDLLNSGIPNAHQEVDDILQPMGLTFPDLCKVVGQINANKVQAALIVADLAPKQAAMAGAQMEMQADQMQQASEQGGIPGAMPGQGQPPTI